MAPILVNAPAQRIKLHSKMVVYGIFGLLGSLRRFEQWASRYGLTGAFFKCDVTPSEYLCL